MLIHLEKIRGLWAGQRLALRRPLFWLLSWLPLLALLCAGAATNAHSAPKTVLVLGDSLSAEYGLSRGSGWVALLEQGLKAHDATVVNASISGETSSGGRTRLPALLAKHHPAIVVIELGANDGLRGLPVAAAEANFRAMLTQAGKAGARVLLVGMHLPPNYGRDYGERFFAMYGRLAREFHAPLVPFMLEGVADTSVQADRLHPTADAHPMILGNIWPRLLPLIQSP